MTAFKSSKIFVNIDILEFLKNLKYALLIEKIKVWETSNGYY